MSNLKYRVAIIIALCLASLWALYPRNVAVRLRQADGSMRDTVERRVPLRKGLDLQGGMYLALEIDDTKQNIPADKRGEAIDRALKTVRNRIEGFGVSEPVIQKAGNDRIIVQLPGIQDPERARRVVQEQAFLEFQITDKTNAFEKVLPRLDQIVKEKGVAPTTPGATGTLVPADKPLQGLLTGTDTAKRDSTKKVAAASKDSAPKDSLTLNKAGAISSLIQQGAMPGEYYVDQSSVAQLERYLSIPEIKAAMPPGKEVLFGSDSTSIAGRTYRALYMVDTKPIITGDYLKDAKPNQSPTDGTIVEFTLDNEGGRRFRNE